MPQETRGRKSSIPDSDLIAIVKARFEPCNAGAAPLTYDELEAKFPKFSRSAIARATQLAFKKGLVELREVEGRAAEVERVSSLEDQLQNTFQEKLREAVVVRVPGIGEGADPRQFGDEVHRLLGEAAAKVLERLIHFMDTLTLGIGSGRGVYHFVRAMENKRLDASGVELLSLTGSMFVRDHAKNVNFFFDADDHVSLLARCFAKDVHLRKMSHSIAFRDPAEKELKIQEIFGPEGMYSPSQAILGVGNLLPGHRFYDAVEDGERRYPLESIFSLLEKLVLHSTCLRDCYEDDDYHACADIGHHVFYVEPGTRKVKPGKEKQLRSNLKNLQSTIDDVNARLLTAGKEVLLGISNIILIAGTKDKAATIHHLLRHEAYNIGMVCTDDETAKHILKLEETI